MRKLLLIPLLPFLLTGCLLVEERHLEEGPPPLTTNGVISMSAAGHSESFIVGAIYRRGMDHPISAIELIELQEAGISDRVMREMVDAPIRRSAPVVEKRRTYYRYDPVMDDAILFGAGAVAGYLYKKHFR